MRRDHSLAILSIWIAAAACPTGVMAERLNVIFVRVDDLGWSDVGCYGSDFYETPNVDELATKSFKFNTA